MSRAQSILGRHGLEPLAELSRKLERRLRDTAEADTECLVERVEVGLSVHTDGACHTIKTVERAVVQPQRQRSGKPHGFVQPHVDLSPLELDEQGHEHRHRT